MDLHERQLFDQVLHLAVGAFTERLIHHHQGPQPALSWLRSGSDQVGLVRGRFVDAFFAEQLLDNADGASFVLRALADQPLPAGATLGTRVEATLIALAKHCFADLLARKTAEGLAQATLFE